MNIHIASYAAGLVVATTVALASSASIKSDMQPALTGDVSSSILVYDVRSDFIDTNAKFAVLCEKAHIECQMVNVGAKAGDATGDPIWLANKKVTNNLLALIDAAGKRCEDRDKKARQ